MLSIRKIQEDDIDQIEFAICFKKRRNENIEFFIQLFNLFQNLCK